MRAPHRRHERHSFYKYCTGEVAKRILTTGRLRWSSPLCFNDPFDVPRDANLGFTPDELRHAVHARMTQLLSQPHAPKNPVFASLNRLLKTKSGQFQRQWLFDSLAKQMERFGPIADASQDAFRSAWEDMVPRLRILCTSEVCDNPTMWAHYSSNHAGAVVELASSDERDSSLLLAEPVIYQQSAPRLPSIETWVEAIMGESEIVWPEYFREYHYVKSLDWAYEREWRVISYDRREGRTLFRHAVPSLGSPGDIPWSLDAGYR